jgi:hypothetical protein
MQLGTHIQPLPQWLKTACHNATTNAKQPALSHHITQCGSPTHARCTPTWPMACHTAPNACPANPQADTHTPVGVCQKVKVFPDVMGLTKNHHNPHMSFGLLSPTAFSLLPVPLFHTAEPQVEPQAEQQVSFVVKSPKQNGSDEVGGRLVLKNGSGLM